MARVVLTALLAAGFATSAIVRSCQDFMIPLDISARNGVFNLSVPTSNIEVTNFVLNLSQVGTNYTAVALENYATVSGHYKLAVTYCEPPLGPGRALQVLTHGIGFDRSYWDLPTNDYNYSYVSRALDAGFSTLAYDRLGIGQSFAASLDPVSDVQLPLEVAALHALTRWLRRKQLPGMTASYDKIVHAGHSFGAVQTYALAALQAAAASTDGDDKMTDGIILQGFSQFPGGMPFFLLGGGFIEARDIPRLAAYPPGYLAAADRTAVQTNFFSPGMFDEEVLDVAFAMGQPVTVGELLTIGGGAAMDNAYAGPVMILTGQRDIPFCQGNCTQSDISIPGQSQQYFTNTTIETVIVPGAGHGLNLEYSHPFTFRTMLDFFERVVPPTVDSG